MKTSYKLEIEALIKNEEFQKLATIGGQTPFHLEDNALVHTNMVAREAVGIFGQYSFMHLVALLHDIGKIYTGRLKTDGVNWEYPHHSDGGAIVLQIWRSLGIITLSGEDYILAKWLIFNHIQTLFMKGSRAECIENLKSRMQTLKGSGWFEDIMNVDVDQHFDKLVWLGVCDITGSKSAQSQDETIKKLQTLLVK